MVYLYVHHLSRDHVLLADSRGDVREDISRGDAKSECDFGVDSSFDECETQKISCVILRFVSTFHEMNWYVTNAKTKKVSDFVCFRQARPVDTLNFVHEDTCKSDRITDTSWL